MATVRTREEQPPAFRDLLKRYRAVVGLTQEELAERARLSVRAIADLERGARRTPRKDTVQLLAVALSLSPDDRILFEAAARPRAATSTLLPPASILGPAGGATPPLVGRAGELALLEQHLAGEGPPSWPPLLLLAGEPGIGKSRLLREATVRGPKQGWTVLEGGCQRQGGQEPYAPLLQALERHIARQSRAQQLAGLHGCAWLVRLLPELEGIVREPSPAGRLPPAQERRLMFAAVARFLANVGGQAGTLLVLDDLQWAGSDALDLLTTLVRSAPQAPLRVVGAYRNTEVRPDDPLSVTLADLGHAGLVAHRTLVPLTPVETRQLLDRLLAGMGPLGEGNSARRELVVRRADGVPFFVVSYAQGLRTQSDAVPWDVAQSVRQRVAALPEPAREVLRAAAVAGRVTQPDLLAAVITQSEGAVLAALETACMVGLLVEVGGGYQFAHDVIREVVETDAGAARRRILHRGIADAWEQARSGAQLPVELLAYHYSRAGVQDKAAHYLELAGDRAVAQSAHTAATGYYQDLVDCLDDMGRTVDAARAREKLGAVLEIAARYEESLPVLEEAVETYRATGDLDGRARVLARIGLVHASMGRPREGVERLRPLLEPLEARGPSRGLAALYHALAALFFAGDQYQEGLWAVERAADLARSVGDERMLAQAERGRGHALRMVGRVAEALPALQEAVRVAEALGDLTALCLALDSMTSLYVARGEFDTARLYAERAFTLAERLGSATRIAIMTSVRGYIAFLTGDWSTARVDLERAVSMYHEIGASVLSPWELGRLRLAEGAWEEASRYLEECTTIAHRSGDLQALRLAQGTLAERDLLQGRPAAALARLVPLLDRPGMEEWHVTELLPLLAWAHLEIGEVAQATEVVARAIARARRQTQHLSLVDALRVQALVAIRQERWDDAARSLEEALALTRRMGYSYGEARVLHMYGLLHAHKGEKEPAREWLEAALAIFRRLGARKDVERAAQAIADLPCP